MQILVERLKLACSMFDILPRNFEAEHESLSLERKYSCSRFSSVVTQADTCETGPILLVGGVVVEFERNSDLLAALRKAARFMGTTRTYRCTAKHLGKRTIRVRV